MFVLDLSKLHDKLTGALIGLARATENNEHLISASTDNVILECTDFKLNLFFYRALYAIGMDSWKADDLLPIIKETEEFLNKDLP